MTAHHITTADLYALLGVAPRASLPVIKAAHRALARRYHPDLGGDATLCAAVNVAWDVLSDPKRRALYDKVRTAGAPAACSRCTGTGSITVQAGFRGKAVKVCPACLGSGLL